MSEKTIDAHAEFPITDPNAAQAVIDTIDTYIVDLDDGAVNLDETKEDDAKPGAWDVHRLTRNFYRKHGWMAINSIYRPIGRQGKIIVNYDGEMMEAIDQAAMVLGGILQNEPDGTRWAMPYRIMDTEVLATEARGGLLMVTKMGWATLTNAELAAQFFETDIRDKFLDRLNAGW